MKIKPYYTDVKYMAYPWLDSDGTKTNYVDFEVATDVLASEIGQILAVIEKGTEMFEIISTLCNHVYHINALLRNDAPFPMSFLEYVKDMYDGFAATEVIDEFYLPTGNIVGSKLHVLRAKAKQIVRIVYLSESGFNRPEIISYFSILSLLFFRLAFKENKKDNMNILFKSQVY